MLQFRAMRRLPQKKSELVRPGHYLLNGPRPFPSEGLSLAAALFSLSLSAAQAVKLLRAPIKMT